MNFESKTVKTRKAHNCWGCWRKFEVGTTMTKCTGVQDGRFWHVYWCPVCLAFGSEYLDYMYDELVEGELGEADPESWEAIRVKMEGQAEEEI